MLEVLNLQKQYGQFTAVENLSFTVRPGEVLGLVGPNGAGKTTTLRSICGIIPATSGRIVIAGHNLQDVPEQAKQQLAFFPDEPRLFDYLSVRQHLNFIASLYQVDDWENQAELLLTEFELQDKADQLTTELSRGMKQKLAIACGLLHNPQVLFFDEPLTGLDPLSIRNMKNSIRERAGNGATIVLSSHLISLLEEVCTHVLILKQGRQVAQGTLQEVKDLFADGDRSLNLEEIFIRATGDGS